jgi:hypothetical protein
VEWSSCIRPAKPGGPEGGGPEDGDWRLGAGSLQPVEVGDGRWWGSGGTLRKIHLCRRREQASWILLAHTAAGKDLRHRRTRGSPPVGRNEKI